MGRKLNISFFGSSLVSAYWNGAATYYRGIIRALAGLGHQITFYEPDAYDRQKHRDIEDPSWARVVIYQPTIDGAVEALKTARGSDLLIKTSGVGVLDEFIEGAVFDICPKECLVAFWDVDAPATLDRISRNRKDPFNKLIPDYDVILTYGGGEAVIRGYVRAGARLCVPVYNALDPDTHHRTETDERFAGDLGLLANRLPDRESRIEEFFLKPASQLPNLRFVLGGNGWADKPMPPNISYVGHVYTRDHNAFNSSPRAVLNVNRDSMASYGFSPPTRVFEAAGAGACLITDEWVGIDHFLSPGSEVLVAKNGEAVAAHIASLEPERAREIGAAARKRILAEHTYAHRAAQLQDLLEQFGAYSTRIAAAQGS